MKKLSSTSSPKGAQAAREAEAQRIASICAESDPTNEVRRQAWLDYCAMFRRALDEGRIWTPERVRALYPTLKEIVDEIEEIDRSWAEFEKRSAAALRGWQKRRGGK